MKEFKFLKNNIKLKMLLIMLQIMLLSEYVKLLKFKVLILLIIQPIFHQVMLNQLIQLKQVVHGFIQEENEEAKLIHADLLRYWISPERSQVKTFVQGSLIRGVK